MTDQTKKRVKTKYPGVFYRMVPRIGNRGFEEQYYVTYKKDGKSIEFKVGRSIRDDMTPAKAARLRGDYIEGRRQTPQERRRVESERITLDKLWAAYSETLANKRTRYSDNNRYGIHIQPMLGHKTLAELATRDVGRLKNRMTEDGKSPQTQAHVITLIKRILNYGFKNGLCPAVDPTRLRIESPKVDNQKTEFLDAGQIKNLLAALDEYWDQPTASILRFALFTGMRRGAILSLKWADVDFGMDIITLRGATAKSGRTEVIPMSDATRAVLERLPERGEYVFAGETGGKRSAVPPGVIAFLRERGVLPDGFRPLHGLRHTYASLLASSGKVDMYVLQKLLTHSKPEMTQRYAHLHNEALKKAANVIGDMFETGEDA